MKFKKLFAIILTVFMVASFTACKKDGDELTTEQGAAKWDQFEDLSFVDFLTKGITASYGEVFEDVKVEISCEEGWVSSRELNTDGIGEGAHPVTYHVQVTYGGNKDNYSFFMVQEGDKLSVKGAQESGLDDSYSEEEAKDMLLDLVEYM